MAAGDMPDGINHGQNRESEGQSNAGESDAERGKASGEYGRAASAENQPEGSKEFRCCAFTDRHKGDLLASAMALRATCGAPSSRGGKVSTRQQEEEEWDVTDLKSNERAWNAADAREP